MRASVDGNQKSGDHQLRLVAYPIISRVLYTIPGGCLGILKHQQYEKTPGWKSGFVGDEILPSYIVVICGYNKHFGNKNHGRDTIMENL